LAGAKFRKKLMKQHSRPEEVVTDGLRSYDAALQDIGAKDRQLTGRSENIWGQNTYQPFRSPERAMMRFRRIHSLQKFAAVHR
jgi:putative transposase